MAWPNPFRKRTENTRTCWGYTFELTPEHLTPEQTLPLKHSYDVLGEECLKRLNDISPPPPRPSSSSQSSESLAHSEKKTTKQEDSRVDSPMQDVDEHTPTASTPPPNEAPLPPPPKRDLFALLRAHHHEDPKLQQLWTELHTVPPWVDWAQIARGQHVFYRYGGPAITGLAYQSLLGGMGAARVVEVLARTGGFSTRVARRRLYETMQHILQCTRSLESLQPGGEGFASSVRVRLLHAAVRMRILELAKRRPGYYSVEKLGVPINDLDSIATIGTFSGTLIWLSFPRQGIYLKEQEIEDYIALWRYIAYLVGCPTDQFATPAKAKAVMEILLLYEVHPSETSAILANNIILSLRDQPPTWASSDMLIASARWLNGNDLCDALQLPRPSLYYWALMAGQCFFFVLFIYTNRAVPAWDAAKIEFVKKIYYAIIVESKTGLDGREATFEFKYVPEFETITEMGRDGKVQVVHRGADSRNLKYFLIGLTGLSVGAWVTSKLVKVAVRGVVAVVGYGLSVIW